MRLDIVTPEKKAFSDEIESVVVPGEQGELGILKSHAPLVTNLKPGELRYLKDGEETSIAIGTGLVEISHDQVSVLTDMAFEAEQIDESAVEDALARAQEELAGTTTPEDHAAAMVVMQKTLAQLQVKRRRKHL